MNMRKEEFLSNERNKQRLINLLSEMLQMEGYVTIHSEGDADLLIEKTAVGSTKMTVVGDVTDLLVLLI